MTIKGRVGVFFIFISLIVLLIFSLTFQADQPNFVYLFVSIVGFLFGGLLIWRNRPPAPPDERFRSLRTSREKRAEKKKKKKEEEHEQ
jgi:hypothetical protein